VTLVRTKPFVTTLFVGDDELLNGLFPAARYGFILSPSTLNDTGVSATRTLDFFSLSFPFLSTFKRRSQYLHEGYPAVYWAKGHNIYCRLVGGPHV